MLDAQYRAEEKYTKLSVGFDNSEEKERIIKAIDEVTSDCNKEQLEQYTCKVSGGREVIVVEYHDDNIREGGEMFEALIKKLNISCCD